MKFAQYVRSVDSGSVGQIIRISKEAKPTIITVRWLVSGVRADYYEDQLRGICPACAGEGGFGIEQLKRARAECEECGP
jgi:hypothetical protein